MNRVHNGRIEEHKSKEFDIITMKQYSADRTDQLFNKKNTQSAWEKVQKDTAKIKTGGFNWFYILFFSSARREK